MKREFILVGVFGIMSAFLAFGVDDPSTAKDNLIQNPSFEDGADGKVNSWTPYMTSELKKAEWDQAVSHTGNASVMLEQDRAWQGYTRFEQVIDNINAKDLKGSVWIKGDNIRGFEGINAGARIFIKYHYDDGEMEEEYLFPGLYGTFDWEWKQFRIAKEKVITKLLFYVDMDGCDAGKAWFDDVALQKMAPGQRW